MPRNPVAFAAVAAVVLAATPARAAEGCASPNVLILLDRSGSMSADGKWESALAAAQALLSTNGLATRFGLGLFPWPGGCDAGQVLVEPSEGTRGKIMDTLNRNWPGGATPLGGTLLAAASSPALADATRARHVLLVTDGQETCDGDPIAAVRRLKTAGIGVFVVGFGTGVDPAALDRLATEGGTARPMSPRYYQADNAAELRAAFDEIAARISVETCDGRDNDCDGIVDEDLTRACDQGCGAGTERCAGGAWVECNAPGRGPAGQCCTAETCNGRDDDCDGVTDEGGLCAQDELCACGACAAECNRGECVGTQMCVDAYCVAPGCDAADIAEAMGRR